MSDVGAFAKARAWFGGLHPAGQAALVGVLFVAAVGATWNATLIPAPFVIEEVNAEGPFITSWPAGPLAGVAPGVISADPDGSGCISLSENDSIELQPHTQSSAIFVRADPEDKVIVSWVSTEVDQRILIPDTQFANEFEQGRVTVTLAGLEGDDGGLSADGDGGISAATAQVEVGRGRAQVCGVQSLSDFEAAVSAGGGDPESSAAPAELLSSWPSGPLAGQPPTAQGVTVDGEGCVAIDEFATAEFVPDAQTSTIFVFADPSADVQLEWLVNDQVLQSLTIPEVQLANDFEQGRVTVTLAPEGTAPPDSTVRITANSSDAQVCGVVGS